MASAALTAALAVELGCVAGLRAVSTTKAATASRSRDSPVVAAMLCLERQSLFALALATGMRRGELLGLRWEDVDLPRRALHVRRALERYQGAYRLVEPKSARGVRSISLPSFAFHALERQRALQEAERDRAGSVWTEWGLVFTT